LPELEEFIRTYSISILVGVVSAVILGAAVAMAVAMRQRRQQEALLRVREVATIVEEIRMTGAGRICWVLLGSIALFSCAVGYYYLVETVVQQIRLGMLVVVGLFVFGLGAALGRRRTYTVYQHRVRPRSADHSHERPSDIQTEAEESPSSQYFTR
jgi:hypothetical protein